MFLENYGIKISVVVPFYKGNKFLERLLDSVESVSDSIGEKNQVEVVIVNDSPEVEIKLPNKKYQCISIIIIQNETNVGIQGARINGLKYTNGDWVIFLDQDDELNIDGFKDQIMYTFKGDVVVGNMLYDFQDKAKLIYKNRAQMNLFIKEDNFIKLRNMIPSPGACLIKKKIIPKIWIANILKNNGADDWFLWISLFENKARFVCNEKCVYKHNDAGGANLSYNLEKMYDSALEMVEIIKGNSLLNDKAIDILKRSINFKYYKDTKKYTKMINFKYANTFLANIFFKLRNFVF